MAIRAASVLGIWSLRRLPSSPRVGFIGSFPTTSIRGRTSAGGVPAVLAQLARRAMRNFVCRSAPPNSLSQPRKDWFSLSGCQWEGQQKCHSYTFCHHAVHALATFCGLRNGMHCKAGWAGWKVECAIAGKLRELREMARFTQFQMRSYGVQDYEPREDQPPFDSLQSDFVQ